MSIKWIGAILIVVGCGGFGFTMGAIQLREEKKLRELISALDFMVCELHYRLTPLPDLCRLTAGETRGYVRDVYLALAEELEAQISPDVQRCMQAALSRVPEPPGCTGEFFLQLGQTLGRFDLEGQLKGFETVRSACRERLESLINNKETRHRSYQTLGICAGAALAILFI